ncbi:MAG: hypothetical protein KBT48_02630 [Firmicutes bacterium]|nr:hypothetical protein [Bacillota bacterium]
MRWEEIYKRLLFLFLFLNLAGCSTSSVKVEKPVEKSSIETEKTSMKLFINEQEIPVIWENNKTVKEFMEEVNRKDIVVSMSMYSNNEQVGSLGRSYSKKDTYMTTHNGDIVLYNASNIVLFYGSNSWDYTKLGKMDLSKQEVIDLLSNGNVRITITK